mgnify:CR=1 FL=1
MKRYMEIAIITAQATYMVDTLSALETELKFLKKVKEKVERIEMRCYERPKDAMFELGECICIQRIG